MSAPVTALYIETTSVANALMEPSAIYLVARNFGGNVSWAIAHAKTDRLATLYTNNGGLLTVLDDVSLLQDPNLLLLLRVARPNWIDAGSFAHLFNAVRQGLGGVTRDLSPNGTGRDFCVQFLTMVIQFNSGGVTPSLASEMEVAVQVARQRRGNPAVRYIRVTSSCIIG